MRSVFHRAGRHGRDEVKGREMGLPEFSETLWRERELLDLLAFKLEEEALLVEAGRTRWLDRAAREVDLLLVELRRTELLRAVQADDLARDLGLAPGATLRAIAAAAGEPWATILDDHRRALVAAAAEVSAATGGGPVPALAAVRTPAPVGVPCAAAAVLEDAR